MYVLGEFISPFIRNQQYTIIITTQTKKLQISKMPVPELQYAISSPDETFQYSIEKLYAKIDAFHLYCTKNIDKPFGRHQDTGGT